MLERLSSKKSRSHHLTKMYNSNKKYLHKKEEEEEEDKNFYRSARIRIIR